ncbi:MAG: hypothetical protein JW953_21340 [Anaerolineae bacterium]|nr:hypothetical protein [Anaerolineae bacterium]
MSCYMVPVSLAAVAVPFVTTGGLGDDALKAAARGADGVPGGGRLPPGDNNLVGKTGRTYLFHKRLLQNFEGEELGEVPPFRTKYLKTEAERVPFEVFVKDGLLVHPDGTPVNTTSLIGGSNTIFVMDPQGGRIFIKADPTRFEFHHSTFLAGQPVAAAGDLDVVNGVITRVRPNTTTRF